MSLPEKGTILKINKETKHSWRNTGQSVGALHNTKKQKRPPNKRKPKNTNAKKRKEKKNEIQSQIQIQSSIRPNNHNRCLIVKCKRRSVSVRVQICRRRCMYRTPMTSKGQVSCRAITSSVVTCAALKSCVQLVQIPSVEELIRKYSSARKQWPASGVLRRPGPSHVHAK